MWGWKGGWIQDKCPPLIGGLVHGGGSDEMGRPVKLVCRRGGGRRGEVGRGRAKEEKWGE